MATITMITDRMFKYENDRWYPHGNSPMLKRSVKIPKGQSESVYRRRTDNTMAKRKSTNNDQQNMHIKLKIE